MSSSAGLSASLPRSAIDVKPELVTRCGRAARVLKLEEGQ